MSNISQLQNYINQYRTYQEVNDKAFEIDENWRSETWTRGLRCRKNILPLKNEKGHIIAYIPSDSPKTPLEGKQSDKTEDLGQSQDRLFVPERITH